MNDANFVTWSPGARLAFVAATPSPHKFTCRVEYDTDDTPVAKTTSSGKNKRKITQVKSASEEENFPAVMQPAVLSKGNKAKKHKVLPAKRVRIVPKALSMAGSVRSRGSSKGTPASKPNTRGSAAK